MHQLFSDMIQAANTLGKDKKLIEKMQRQRKTAFMRENREMGSGQEFLFHDYDDRMMPIDIYPTWLSISSVMC